MKNPCFPLAILCLLCGSLSADEKPNVIVIMADDMGYGDLSCYGAHNFETPNIDQLAAEGVRFTSGYCSASTDRWQHWTRAKTRRRFTPNS